MSESVGSVSAQAQTVSVGSGQTMSVSSGQSVSVSESGVSVSSGVSETSGGGNVVDGGTVGGDWTSMAHTPVGANSCKTHGVGGGKDSQQDEYLEVIQIHGINRDAVWNMTKCKKELYLSAKRSRRYRGKKVSSKKQDPVFFYSPSISDSGLVG